MSGIPLGPLLFLIYVNDLLELISSQVFYLLTILSICELFILIDHEQLQTDSDKLAKWCKVWQLNFYASKCKVVHFGQAMHS